MMVSVCTSTATCPCTSRARAGQSREMGRQRHASETVRLEDMRLFAAVADARSITGAARRLAMPKQTVSRRVAQLEMDLGVSLMHRTTRTLRLTEAGAAYAQRCREIVRIADEANRAVTEVD